MKIKYPINVRFIFSTSCLCLMMIVVYWFKRQEAFLIIGGICSLFIVAAIIRRALKPRKLQLKDDVIVIQDRKIKANEINNIYIEFLETVGIRPNHKKIVPFDLVFEFVNKDDIKRLSDWAERNGVEIKHRPFVKWL